MCDVNPSASSGQAFSLQYWWGAYRPRVPLHGDVNWIGRFVFVLIAVLLVASITAHAQSHGKVTQSKPLHPHKLTDTVGVVNDGVITYADFQTILNSYIHAYVERTRDSVITDSLFSIIVD